MHILLYTHYTKNTSIKPTNTNNTKYTHIKTKGLNTLYTKYTHGTPYKHNVHIQNIHTYATSYTTHTLRTIYTKYAHFTQNTKYRHLAQNTKSIQNLPTILTEYTHFTYYPTIIINKIYTYEKNANSTHYKHIMHKTQALHIHSHYIIHTQNINTHCTYLSQNKRTIYTIHKRNKLNTFTIKNIYMKYTQYAQLTHYTHYAENTHCTYYFTPHYTQKIQM